MSNRHAAAALRRLLHAAEPLEPRRLLASLSGGVLSIDGTSASERFTVAVDGTDLVVTRNSAAGERFVRSGVTRIDAALGNGDDSLKIDFAVDVPASLNGEAGNDTLVGGRGADTLDGGSGNDLLNGGEDATTHSSGDLDHHDTVTYASRTTAITASLTIVRASIYDDGAFFSPDENGHGTGGASGEADSYQNLESIVGGSGNDSFTLAASSSTSASGSDFITLRANGGAGRDAFVLRTGTQSSDPLLLVADGGANDDTFDFGGIDTVSLIGGDGDDGFYNSSDDSGAVIDAGAGVDVLDYSNTPGVSYTMPAGLENLIAAGNTVHVVGNASDNVITVRSGSSTVDGRGGNDTIDFSGVNTPVTGNLATHYSSVGNSVAVTTSGTVSTDSTSVELTDVEVILGGSGNDVFVLVDDGSVHSTTPLALRVVGNGGNDQFLTVNEGDTQTNSATTLTADGGAGNDSFAFDGAGSGRLVGGEGDDRFENRSDDSSARIEAGAGSDAFVYRNSVGINYTMPDDLERFSAEGYAIRVVGNSFDNQIFLDAGGTADGGGGDDLISGGNYLFDGSGVKYSLAGGSGRDTLVGYDHEDTLDGGTGDDKIFGGEGDDSIRGGNGNDQLYGEDLDESPGGSDDDTIDGEAGDDSLYGALGDDCLVGGSGNDRIDPGAGNDTVDGGAGGGDAVTYESRSTPVTGILTASLVGSGSSATRQTGLDATLAGGEHDIGLAVEVLSGSTGADVLIAIVNDADWAAATNADRSPLIVNGVAGDDTLEARAAVRDGAAAATPATLANAGAGDDSLAIIRTGTAALDYAMPNDLEDVFVTSAAVAKVTGNGGANRIEVQSTTNGIVYGGAGDDSIYGGGADDTLYGQDGRDKIYGRAGDDRIDGGNSNDILRGEDGDDKVYGRDGNDQLSGGEGRDSLYGDAGNDKLNGDGGRDINYGGAGVDVGAKQSIDRIFKQIEELA